MANSLSMGMLWKQEEASEFRAGNPRAPLTTCATTGQSHNKHGQVYPEQNEKIKMFTLFANILHSYDELLLQVLAVLGNLLALFQKVLRGLFHRQGQNMGLLGAALLLTGRTFVAGVHQSGHL